MAVVLIATLDTKGAEAEFVGDLIRAAGIETIVVDGGTRGQATIGADVGRDEVARLAGGEPPADRGEAVARSARGVAEAVRRLDEAGRVDAVVAIGGSAGTAIGTAAMRGLPIGRPKLMVSTVASGQVGPYVGGRDILMFHPVADLAGLNRITRAILANAAHAVVGMVRGGRAVDSAGRRVVAATMFGVTTPCVDRARRAVEAAGFEVIVFHATGSGGRSMERLIDDGLVDGLLDLTTTEWADEVVGGILSAGPDRLGAACRVGLPQVVSVGALDMVNFGPRATVPPRFEGRTFHVHNEAVTLMRTTPAESAEIGRRMAEILRTATGPVAVLLPLGGVSALDAPGMPFHDPEADAALFSALTRGLADRPEVRIVERPEAINDPAFAAEAARVLLDLMPALPSEPRP